MRLLRLAALLRHAAYTMPNACARANIQQPSAKHKTYPLTRQRSRSQGPGFRCPGLLDETADLPMRLLLLSGSLKIRHVQLVPQNPASGAVMLQVRQGGDDISLPRSYIYAVTVAVVFGLHACMRHIYKIRLAVESSA